jgi:hypothetical protein
MDSQTPYSQVFSLLVKLTLSAESLNPLPYTVQKIQQISQFYQSKYARSHVERILVIGKQENGGVEIIIRFSKRYNFRATADQNTIDIDFPPKTSYKENLSKFGEKHKKGQFDELWEDWEARTNNRRSNLPQNQANDNIIGVMWTSDAWKKSSKFEKIAALESQEAQIQKLFELNPTKAIGSGLKTSLQNIALLQKAREAQNLPEFKWHFPEHLT